MRVYSLIQENSKLVPVEVELTLWPGLPGIQFLGLPDQHLKESAHRIKSAIRSQGYKFPVAQQVLVNLRPSHLKKTSRGLELAVAVALLWETEQVPSPIFGSDFFVYGELGLMGEVYAPADLCLYAPDEKVTILTGVSDPARQFPFRTLISKNLVGFLNPTEIGPTPLEFNSERPIFDKQLQLSQDQLQLLQVVASGGHSLLLAGPAGSGKTTFAEALHSFLPAPSAAEMKDVQKIHGCQELPKWPALVKPHHTIPIMSMIGGGNQPQSGEISRAHHGILLLDELLEFHPRVIEALRGPFEEGKIRVARQGKLVEYPAQAQIISTTNLCPCGDWTPAQKRKGCRYSLHRCRSYSERLSGPFVDRFELMEFSKGISHSVPVDSSSVIKKIEEAVHFRKKRLQKRPNSRASIVEIESTVDPFCLKELLPSFSSIRRRHATLRAARTLADLEGQAVVDGKHIDRVLKWTVHNFQRLSCWD